MVDPSSVDGPGVGAVGPREVILSSGERVPYPEPSSAAATKIGVANRRRDTAAEPRLRSELHARGLRFRKDLLIRAGRVRVHPDIVFTRAKVAVFLDGCFWHACPEHGTVPKSNVTYWTPKLTANTERDLRVNEALTTDGWMDGWSGGSGSTRTSHSWRPSSNRSSAHARLGGELHPTGPPLRHDGRRVLPQPPLPEHHVRRSPGSPPLELCVTPPS